MEKHAAGMAGPDWIMVAGYFVIMLGIGAWFYSRMRGVKDYFSGGNRIPWWLSGVSFYMSSFSVAAFVFYPSLCYRHGWVGVTLLWVAVPATLFGVLFGVVAGIMVFISLDELLPSAHEHGEEHAAVYGLVGGMAVMAVSLLLAQ